MYRLFFYGGAEKWLRKMRLRPEFRYVKPYLDELKYSSNYRVLRAVKPLDATLSELRIMKGNLSIRLVFFEHEGNIIVMLKSFNKSVEGSATRRVQEARKALSFWNEGNSHLEY